MSDIDPFLAEHERVTRRGLFRAAAGAGLATGMVHGLAPGRLPGAEPSADGGPPAAGPLEEAIARLAPYFTPAGDFRDVSRGKPLPHTLPEARKREVGLTRDTWTLEVVADPEHPARLTRPLTAADGTALRFDDLLRMAERHAVRFAKVMTCLNIGCPLGMGIWEGVPLREAVWLTGPKENIRRVFYHGYHNDDPAQVFRSSLPLSRVLDDWHDLPPVILCYKLNGEWLDSERGGPVRMVVPEAYGFKSVKWLSHVFLSNIPHANDTYAAGNNDLDSPLKSFAATLSVPKTTAAGKPIPVTGYAQVGMAGVSRVQVWIAPADEGWPADDPFFTRAPWVDADLLPPPRDWTAHLADPGILRRTRGFDREGMPLTWPMRLAMVHWAILLPGLPAGDYALRSRTVDGRGIGQPLPNPFQKSGHAANETVRLRVG